MSGGLVVFAWRREMHAEKERERDVSWRIKVINNILMKW